MVELTTIAATAAEGAQLYLESKDYYPYIRSGFYIAVLGASGVIVYKILAPTIRRLTWKPNRTSLQGKVAVVTGASRGVGKGIALGLAEAGATVYVTGRTETNLQGITLPGNIHETAVQVDGLGGKGIPVVCDHAKDEDVAALFDRVLREQGKIDILVNNVFQLPPNIEPTVDFEKLKFWDHGAELWDPVINVGLRSHYIAACHAAKAMTKQRNGLIINISSLGADKYMFFTAYGVGKAGVDRMTQDMAHELKDYNVSVVGLKPGLVKTERMLEETDLLKETMGVNIESAEYPIYTGRAVAALASDSSVYKKSGYSITNDCVAHEYGISDVDGRQPSMPGTIGFYWTHGMTYLKNKIF